VAEARKSLQKTQTSSTFITQTFFNQPTGVYTKKTQLTWNKMQLESVGTVIQVVRDPEVNQ